MEFLFRDAKQNCGLEHCQARSKNKLDFHFNASLSSVNIAKSIIRNKQNVVQPISYSVNDLKMKFQNYKLVKRIFSIFGFDHTLIPKSSNIAIAIVHNSHFHVIYELSIEGVFKILEGEDNWLYLDNDTNKSVEQFTGKTKLSWAEKKNWADYANTFSTLPLSQAGKSAFLIAPSKEFVVEEHYPFKKSKHTPLDQLTKLVDDSFSLVTPIDALKHFEERTFRVCDTHWSCHGARVATMEVAKKLGLDCTSIENLFENDIYVERVMAGDLGSKIYPTQRHAEDFLTTFNYNRVVVYDNNLPNFGRAFILDNPDALNEQTLLVFGSSSVYSMFNYLARIFRTVVFFHTAGNIDKELVDKIAPDFLLAQSNARFVVKAPSFDIKISDYIKDKKRRLTHLPDVVHNTEKTSAIVTSLARVLDEMNAK